MQNYSSEKLSHAIKILTADAVEAAKSGHPGMPMGFSQVMTNLVFNFLKFNPNDPKWPNRDRLVLSAGHGSMLLYAFFYLTGYQDFSLEEIKNFRQLNSKAAGHPENHIYHAIETTTGPLGQGVANAVGMAIAEKKMKAKLGTDISDHKIYAIVGDGCLMEGVSYEALSLAGHLKLNNLIILFDDNNITIDGRTDLAISENQLSKFQAMGFAVMEVDGYDDQQINEALKWAQDNDKPSFIACKTLIGKGSKSKEDSAKAHGSPLGAEEISYLKDKFYYQNESFQIDEELLNIWRQSWKRNEQEYNNWQKSYSLLNDEDKAYLSVKKLSFQAEDIIAEKSEATRVSSGKIIANLVKNNDKIIVGSADLAGSNNLNNEHNKVITSKDFSGNFINYGIREHAMAAIMNGLALSSFSPVGGTFFVFSDYMRPAIRLAALMNLPVIYVMTHDSIGVGEDGPTHQPIEHLSSFRAMPNINLFRPADLIETKECYEIAINQSKPSIFALSRQDTAQIIPDPRLNVTRRKGSPKPIIIGERRATMLDLKMGMGIRGDDGQNMSSKGGYIISESLNQDVTIFATGTEVALAIEVQKILATKNIATRVCSVPCMDILLTQDKSYLALLKGSAKKLVAIEAGSSFGWHRIIGSDGLFFGLDQFGASAPSKDLYKYFGLSAEDIAKSIM